MKRSAVLYWLSELTDKQFVELFYEAVADRNTSDIPGESGHFVIADTSDEFGEGRHTDFIGLPDPDEYEHGYVDDAPICNWAECEKCGASVRSVAKHVICPICGAKVYCT